MMKTWIQNAVVSRVLVYKFWVKDTLFLVGYAYIRNSCRRCPIKKGVLKNFTKFTAKHLRRSLIFNKVAGTMKKKLWYRCFPVNFVKYSRTLFVQITSGRLLLTSRFITRATFGMLTYNHRLVQLICVSMSAFSGVFYTNGPFYNAS